MRGLLLENYEFKNNRTDPGPHLNRLAEFFGSMNGEHIDEERIAEYSRKRLKTDRVQPATRGASSPFSSACCGSPRPDSLESLWSICPVWTTLVRVSSRKTPFKSFSPSS